MLGQFKTPVIVTGEVSPTPGSIFDVNIVSQAITIAVSAASLPLPTGAATEATLLAAKIDLDKFTFLSTRLLVDGSGVVQPVSGPLTDAELRASPVPVTTSTPVITSVVTRVPSLITSQILVAANSSRKGLIFYNDSTSNQYIKFGITATTVDFTVILTSHMIYEVQTPVYDGRIDFISSSATGAIQVTELS